MTAYVCYPPDGTAPLLHTPAVFLAGTIDNGKSLDWQSQVCEWINGWEQDVQVFNPRRADWDSSWEQDISNEYFHEQVTWELNHIDHADYVLFHFEKDSLSPITLLELGIVAESSDTGRAVVSCAPGFWRRGNVQIICERYGLPLFDDLNDALTHLHEAVSS